MDKFLVKSVKKKDCKRPALHDLNHLHDTKKQKPMENISQEGASVNYKENEILNTTNNNKNNNTLNKNNINTTRIDKSLENISQENVPVNTENEIVSTTNNNNNNNKNNKNSDIANNTDDSIRSKRKTVDNNNNNNNSNDINATKKSAVSVLEFKKLLSEFTQEEWSPMASELYERLPTVYQTDFMTVFSHVVLQLRRSRNKKKGIEKKSNITDTSLLPPINKIMEDMGEIIFCFNNMQFLVPRGRWDIEIRQTGILLKNKKNKHIALQDDLIRVTRLPDPNKRDHWLILGFVNPTQHGKQQISNFIIRFEAKYMLTNEMFTWGTDPSVDMLVAELKTEISPFLDAVDNDDNNDEPKSRTRKKSVSIPTTIAMATKVFTHLSPDALLQYPRSAIFQATKGMAGVKCYFKTSDGVLFFLEFGIFFMKRPVLYLPRSALKNISTENAGPRSFNLILSLNDENTSKYTFSMIRREEQENVNSYITYVKQQNKKDNTNTGRRTRNRSYADAKIEEKKESDNDNDNDLDESESSDYVEQDSSGSEDPDEYDSEYQSESEVDEDTESFYKKNKKNSKKKKKNI